MNEKKKSSKTLPRPKAKPKAPPARKRRASEVPHEPETLYRALAEASPDMIFIIGRDDRVEYVNRVAAESLGRKPEDLIGRPRAQFFPSGPSQRQGERISDVFESGKPLFIEHCTPFKGRDLWLHTWLVPLRNEASEVASVLGISRDITERKKMELSLRESEEKYRTLVERANDGILIIQDGVIQYTNRRLGVSSGYEAGEIQGKRFTQFVHPTEILNVVDRYRRRLAGEEVPAIYEMTLLRKDGSKLPVEINAGVINYQGQPADLVIVRDLTERRRAEEKVLESELQHRTTLDFMGDAIHVVDRDLRLVLLNERFKQWCRELGLETEVIGRTVFEAFPFLLETVREEYEQVFRTGETLVTEEASQVGEREIITETRKIPILQGGEVAQVVTVVHDITKRKRGEEALQESQERLARIVETAPDGITIVDRKGRITFANAAAERILGLSRSDITQRVYNDPAWRITTLDGRPFPDEDLPFTRVMRTGEAVFAIEHAIEHPDGRRVFLSINAAPLRDGQGMTSGMVVSLADITERKRADEALRKNYEHQSLILNNIPVVFYTAAPTSDLPTTWISDQILEITGYSPRKFTEEPWFWTSRIHPDDHERVLRDYEAVLTQGSINVEYRWQTADEAYHWFLDTAVLAKDAQGKPREINGIWVDITERKRTEEDLRKSLEKLGQALWETIQAIVLVIETKDPYTAGHQRRSTQLAEAIARELGLPEEQVEGIRMAGFIHDLGKIAVPSELLSKPSPLNEIERAIIQNHVRAGYEILKTVEFPWPVAEIVLQHHEKLDGSGYPKGLRGDSILIEAKILAVADVVEAMASYRPYRPALGIDQALEEIVRYKGARFEPRVVDACLKLFSEKGFSFEPKEEKG